MFGGVVWTQAQLEASVVALMSQQNAIQNAEPNELDRAAWDNAWVEEAGQKSSCASKASG